MEHEPRGTPIVAKSLRDAEPLGRRRYSVAHLPRSVGKRTLATDATPIGKNEFKGPSYKLSPY
jgi:hypothetical protein